MMQVGKAIGMMGLNDALIELFAKKQISAEEAYNKSLDKAGMEGLLKRSGADTKFLAPPPARPMAHTT